MPARKVAEDAYSVMVLRFYDPKAERAHQLLDWGADHETIDIDIRLCWIPVGRWHYLERRKVRLFAEHFLNEIQEPLSLHLRLGQLERRTHGRIRLERCIGIHSKRLSEQHSNGTSLIVRSAGRSD